jgi:hypothetical protein
MKRVDFLRGLIGAVASIATGVLAIPRESKAEESEWGSFSEVSGEMYSRVQFRGAEDTSGCYWRGDGVWTKNSEVQPSNIYQKGRYISDFPHIHQSGESFVVNFGETLTIKPGGQITIGTDGTMSFKGCEFKGWGGQLKPSPIRNMADVKSARKKS